MELITVKKNDLLKVMEENRKKHRAIFEEAFANYRKQAISELEVMLDDARKGKNIQRAVTLSPPADHTRDYDRVIGMLKMTTKEEIELAEHDYGAYVMDDWSWKRNFLVSNSRYSKSASDTLATLEG